MVKKLNEQAALDEALNSPDLLVISGSRLYGTNRPTSDIDMRGFVLPPWEFVAGDLVFKDKDLPGEDHKVYSLKRFLDLVMKGDPQTTELFFAPDTHILRKTEIGEEILALKDHIVSNKIYRRIMGFGYSEWRKAQGKRLIIEKRTPTEDQIIQDIRNHFSLDKSDTDEVVEILMKNKPKKLLDTTKNLGEKRKSEYEKYGFCVSSAAHALRLTGELAELLRTGSITFPRPDADFLRDVRHGIYSLEYLEKVYEDRQAEAEDARDHSILRDSPNSKKVWQAYRKIVVKHLLDDPRFRSYVD